MKTKYFLIIIFIFNSLQIFSQSIDSEASMSKESESVQYNSLEETFVATQLSNREIFAFEARAIQKIKDFAGYLEIISNSEFDKSLREFTLQQTAELFTEGSQIIENDENSVSKSCDLTDYLNEFYKSETSKIEVKIENISVNNHFAFDENYNYKCEINFTQKSTYYKGVSVLKEISTEKTAEVYLKKIEKQFGNETKEVWQVFIGNIF